MKKILTGVIIGLMCSSCITAFAAVKLNFKAVNTSVYVNGNNFKNSATPAVTVNGKLYLPAEQLCEQLNILFTEDSKNNRVDIGFLNPSTEKNATDNCVINIHNYSIENNVDWLYDNKYAKKFILVNIDIINSGTQPIKTVFNTLEPNEKQQGNLPFVLCDGADLNSLKLVYKKSLVVDLK